MRMSGTVSRSSRRTAARCSNGCPGGKTALIGSARGVAAMAAHRVDPARPARDDRQELAPGLRQRHGARGAIEQAHAERLLEMADADGERGLRHVQRLGGTGEVSETGDAQKRLELT